MPQHDAGRLMREVRALVGDTDDLSDGQLLARFVEERDDAAFELLVRRYGRLVFGVCRRVLADSHTAEDAFQATFLVLVHKAATLDRNRPVADWLCTVAFRLASRARANASRRREREADAARNRATSTEPRPDDLGAVYEELTRLPERLRVPLVLSCLEGRSYEQVARAVGCPVGSVGWRLNRAKEVLRERLAHRGVVCPAAGIAALLASAAANAAVPVSLVDATVHAGKWFAGEHAAHAAPSAQAIELARGVIGTMTTNKWALAAGVLLAVGLCGGTAWLARSAAMTEPPKPAAGRPADPSKDTKTAELPGGATSRLGTAQFRHGDVVFFVGYTADGKHLITAGRDNAIRMWDRATGQAVRGFERAGGKKELGEPKAEVMMPGKMMRPVMADDFPVALSRDGRLLAAGKDKTVTLWDTATGKKFHELTANANVFELVFTPDGKTLVAVDTDQTVTLWDAAGGKVAKTFETKAKAEADGVSRTGTAVSPTGTHLVQQWVETGTANASLRVIDLATGKAQDIKLAVGGGQNVTFSPDGKYLAWTSFTDGVTVWDVAAHKEVNRFGGGQAMKPRFFGQSLCISGDGKTVAVTLANDAIELWDVADGKLTRTIGGHETERSNRVVVRIVLGSGNKMTRGDLAFSPDGKSLAVSLGTATVRQFDTDTSKEIAATPGHLSAVIAVGSDARTAVTVSRESVRVWDTAGGEVRHWPLTPPAVAAAVSPDAKFVATASGGGVVRVWDAAKGEKVREIDTKRAEVAGVAFSPDGKLVATKAELNSAVNLWNAATGEHVRTIGQDGEPAFSGGRVMLDTSGMQTPAIAFSADGRLVAATGDKKQLVVWDAATGAVVCEIAAPGRAFGVAFGFSPNGHAIGLLTSDGAAAGYEVATGEKRLEAKPVEGGSGAFFPREMMGGASAVSSLGRGFPNAGSLGFTADGRFLMTSAGNPAVRVWDLLTGEETGQLKGHGGNVSHLRVAGDGKTLVTGSVDTTGLLWDLTKLGGVELTRETPLTAAELDSLWGDLAKPDPTAALAAARKLLTDRKQAAALLGERLRAVPAVEDARMARLVTDLGGAFDARRKAAAELERLGELAAPHLRKALDGNPSLDLKQRVEALLAKANVRKLAGDQLRELRAVELLELAATPEAKHVLESLAKGAKGARLTREADAAIARLSAAK